MIIQKRNLVSIFLLAFVAVAAIIYYLFVLRPQQEYYYKHHVNIQGTYLIHPLEINNFELTDTKGNKFTKDNLQGHWTLLFAGFTHCNSVCPLVMDVLDKTYIKLQSEITKNKLPKIVLLTIDPEADSLPQLNKFLSKFNPDFIGVRGDTRETTEIVDQLHVVVNRKEGNSNINHGGEILLINPQAKIQAYFTYPQRPDILAADYQKILTKNDESNKEIH